MTTQYDPNESYNWIFITTNDDTIIKDLTKHRNFKKIYDDKKCKTTTYGAKGMSTIKGKNIEPLLKEIINSMNQDRIEVLKEKPNLSSEAVSQLLVNRLLHIPITTIKELYTDEELDERTELLIRKLFTSTDKWKGDTGEF